MGWETKFSIQLGLFGLSLVLAMPLGMNLFGIESMAHVASFNELTDDHLFREITGYAGLGIALLQVVFSARKRLEWNFPGPSFPAWRGFHILAGVAFLLIVVIHTGGRLGWNLNGWLQSAFILTVFIGLIGKVWETRLLARALPVVQPRPATHLPVAAGQAVKPPMPPAATAGARASQVRSKINQARNFWLGAHIVLTSAFMTLLGFHVFSVYYF